MKNNRAKWMRIAALSLVAIMMMAALSACSIKVPWANQAAVEEENVAAAADAPPPTPKSNDPTPTPKWTPEPTITPRPVDMAVETPAPGATPLLIEPIDKPVRTFVYTEYTSASLGLTFNVPEGWVEAQLDDETVQFSEPANTAWDGIPASLIIKCKHNASNQTKEDAIAALDGLVESLKLMYPNIEMSLRADNNKILGEPGYYHNFRIAQEGAKPIRGRVVAAAANRIIVTIQMIAPANYFTDYLDMVREFRVSVQQP